MSQLAAYVKYHETPDVREEETATGRNKLNYDRNCRLSCTLSLSGPHLIVGGIVQSSV